MSDATVDGSPLRQARDELGYSREWVAARLQISSKTIERWEKGAPIRGYQLRQLAKLYEVPVAQLQVGRRRAEALYVVGEEGGGERQSPDE